MDKLRGIAEHPLVQRHLRVCWKNYGRRDNCCRCEKCLRTMLMLDALGKLGPFEAFPLRHQLFRRACGVSTIARPIVPIYRELLLAHPRRLIRLAIRIMLLRSWLRSRKQAILRRFLPAD